MAKSSASKGPKNTKAAGTLMVRLDNESKTFLVKAAVLRRISVSDYVRAVAVTHAKKEVLAARDQTISLTPEEQLAFWNALNQAPKLTPSQRQLGRLMRGES